MPVTESQHYYLQSMGIDVYALRDELPDSQTQSAQTSEVQSTSPQVKAPQTKAPVKPSFKVSLSELNASGVMVDVCHLLNIKAKEVVQTGDAQFRLGTLDWVFTEKDDEPQLNKDQLTCPRLSALRQSKAKKVLWQNLTNFLTTD